MAVTSPAVTRFAVTRRKRELLDALADGAATQTELMGILGVTRPAVSKHLRELQDLGAVEVQGYPHEYRCHPSLVVEGNIASVYGDQA